MDNQSNSILRTQRRLRKAYTVLLENKNYKSISVKELTEYAEMSRAAFYLHFDSIEDFSFECSQYLIRKISSQMVFWLSDGRENIEKNCKKKNLLIDENDRKLFCQYLHQEIYFTGKSSFDVVTSIFYDFVAERFGVSREECRTDSKLNFFIRAYAASIMESVDQYESKRMSKEISYVYTIWEKLFPEYKL